MTKPSGLWTALTCALVLRAGAEVGAQPPGPRAGVYLSNASATVTQTSTTEWTLDKIGAVDPTARMVTWTVTATQGATVGGQLVVHGQMTVTNFGAIGATIGNIVVNLQTKAGSSWRTRASDVANATDDDAATTARVVASATAENVASFAESAASGPLRFMDATSNSAFALVPQVTIAPGATVSLLFSAAFNNNLLRLATGTAARAEVIVTFGNAGPSGASAANLDIDGSGAIEADEAYVRSVPARIGLSVPAQMAGNGTVTLSDTVDDITTTGTVSFSNPVFDLVGTSGMVTVSYEPGTAGGSITNCAHLTSSNVTVTTGGFTFPSVAGVNLQACDTQAIPPIRTCTPGAPGCGWADGDLVTYNQDNWGTTSTNAALLLANYFDFIYPGGVQIGLPGNTGFSAVFTSADAVLAYQPASGPSGVFDNDLVDPVSTSAGIFGGYLLAVQLDVDFGDAHHLDGAAMLLFGDLRVCGLTATPGLNGSTVRQVLGVLNQAIGGDTTPYSIDDLAQLAFDLARSFESGSVSLFAQQHLVNGPCGWADGEVITYTQLAWGDPTSTAGTVLYNQYDDAYFATGGVLEVGTLGAAGYSMAFTSAGAVLGYLPAIGNVGALDTDLVDPGTSASGAFGGEVVALRLNIDFAAAGHTVGNSGLLFGDLTMCGLTSSPTLNGLSASDFLAILNSALGGGPAPYTIAVLHLIAEQVNAAFSGGNPTLFAQQHLFVGACPP